MTSDPAVLVMAKAPVPGRVKTRLAASVGDQVAAELAAAALLDTLTVVAASGLRCVVAWSGPLSRAIRAGEIKAALAPYPLIPQRGHHFPQRLAAAHHDASDVFAGTAVVQVGSDTPQLSVGQLHQAATALSTHDAALGLAHDGGWWALGVRTAALAVGLAKVPTSHADTGRRTLAMLVESHASVSLLAVLRDVDTLADAQAVLRHPHCGGRFAAAAEAAVSHR